MIFTLYLLLLTQEIDCLQDNYDNLEEPCKWAIGNFTEDESADIRLDKILMKSCMPMINKFCKVNISKISTQSALELILCFNPVTDKFSNLNFHPLEVVSPCNNPQLMCSNL